MGPDASYGRKLDIRCRWPLLATTPNTEEVVVVVVDDGQGGIFVLDVGHIVGTLNNSRCNTKHRLPYTITPFY